MCVVCAQQLHITPSSACTRNMVTARVFASPCRLHFRGREMAFKMPADASRAIHREASEKKKKKKFTSGVTALTTFENRLIILISCALFSVCVK